MRYNFFASVAFAALIATAPASFAFEIQHTTNTGSFGANFANNPDSQGDSMSSNLGGNGSPVMHFGNTTLRFNGGGYGSDNSYGTSPAYREEFMGGPGQIGNAISPR
jgi:hypothetical protein